MKGLFIIALLSSGLFLSAVYPGLNFKEKESMILNAVINYLDALHFKPATIDDSFSEQAFDNYIGMIDPGKRLLIQSEVDQLAAYKDQIDDQVNSRSFQFFDVSVGIIDNARERMKNIFYELIETDLSVKKNEKIEMDSDKRDFVESDEELKVLWRKLLKYDLNSRLRSKIKSQEKAIKAREEGEEEPKEKTDYDNLKSKKEPLVIKSEKELKNECIKAIKKSYETYFKNIDKERRSDKFETYVNSITHLFDPHSDYLNPKEKEDFDIRMGGKLEGIGARLSTQDDMTKVVSIIVGGPAWKGKELQVDDLITAVTQKGEEPLNIVGMRLDDVVQKIRGDKGTIVILTVKKPDGSVVEIEIERDEVIIDEAFAKSLILDMPKVVDNVGYIRLPKFYSSFENEGGNSCAKDVKLEIEKLNDQNVNAIILDLRNNGGGSLKDVVDMTGLFIKEGPIVQVKPRTKPAYVYEDEDPEVHYTGPLVVMVNQFSASASEILAAALQDYGRAVIVGSTSTFGKGTVQRFVDLDRAYRDYDEIKPLGNLKITMQKFYRVNGGSTQLKGVEPDIVLPNNYHFIDTGEKDYDHAMEWSEIPAVEYSQNVYSLSGLENIVNNSNARIKQNKDFQLIYENAARLKENRDNSVYPLHFPRYIDLNEKREKAAEKFDDLFETEIGNLHVKNLKLDMEKISIDESTIVRNKDWVEGVKKDIYLEEVIHILKDMIDSQANY
ncbi:MAG: carboxy terminal-processing peptidase [Saprospiraceae bacterium]|nr:carboxy terminal-processing peptidase [Bacteroidia bacterium]NNE15359.1 carboxy terminal-processing peptidase [Saprospiraceae bacterium]